MDSIKSLETNLLRKWQCDYSQVSMAAKLKMSIQRIFWITAITAHQPSVIWQCIFHVYYIKNHLSIRIN